jgi:hypothetical protein
LEPNELVGNGANNQVAIYDVRKFTANENVFDLLVNQKKTAPSFTPFISIHRYITGNISIGILNYLFKSNSIESF